MEPDEPPPPDPELATLIWNCWLVRLAQVRWTMLVPFVLLPYASMTLLLWRAVNLTCWAREPLHG